MKSTNSPIRSPKMKRLFSLLAGVVAAGLALCGGTAQAQSSIGSLYPNGTNMFQPSATLSFTANSPAGVTNVTVQLTVISLYTGQSFVKNLTAANGLTITGPTTGLNVSAALTSNTLYSATIQVRDASGSLASQTFKFDTIKPAYTWEAEDWNYTSNSVSGLYIDNPQTNAYAGLDTTDNVDAHNANGNPSSYRPSFANNGNGGLYTEDIGAPESNYKRLQYIGTGRTDYNVGFTDNGDFGNYTRTYPAGTYNLFVRAAGGNGPKTESADVSVASGGAVINSPASGPFKFGVKGNGWQNYDFMPVTDSGGNLVQITFDGNPATLNVLQAPDASDNMNFFMLMPTNVVVPSTVTVTNVSPDGAALFNPAGAFAFDAYSPGAPIDPNNIILQVTATNLWGHGYSSNLDAASGLTITGPSTNLHVSLATTSNTIYSVFIQITDGNGTASSQTVSFDTIVAPPVTPTAGANYTFEAEDFDHGNGQYFDNPQTNAYFGFDGVAEVDYHATQHGGAYNRIGLTTETLNEKQRPQYAGTGKQDYDVGFNDGGNWGNYTRNYPAGNYNIYVRVANGTGNNTAESGTISLVTSGAGTPTQTLLQLGKFGVPATGGWGNYVWVPVKDPVGNLAQFTGGSVATLRMTITGGNCNENFFLLTPVDPTSVLQPYIDGFTPNGAAMFQPSNTVNFVVHSQPGTATSNIGLNLNGVNVSGLTFSGTANTRNVTYAIQPNNYYTAIVTVTDANGTASLTNTFGTFSSTNYQWEAEDYDYANGSFFDNPQVDAYNGLGTVEGVDYHDAATGGTFTYRTQGTGTSTTSDGQRDQFIGFTDYNIGFFENGEWANYTRNYPAGTYYVMLRSSTGNGSTTTADLDKVTAGYGTPGQTTVRLGTFTIPSNGWDAYGWQQLKDGSGQAARIVLSGSTNTLRLSRAVSTPGVNVNFMMLVAAPPLFSLTVTVSGGAAHISIPTQNGYSYQVYYKNLLTDANWTPLGSPVSGNGAVQVVNDPTTTSSRFYRVQAQ